MEKTKWNINILEKIFFLLVTLLNLIPLFLYKYLPTVDGPAHLNNAHLLLELLKGDSSTLTGFFQINPQIVPNWTATVLLSFFDIFLPFHISEKLLIASYLFGLPYAFRGFIKVLQPTHYFLVYFIFPFTYTFMVFMGFYNFNLAIVLVFILLKIWVKNYQQLRPKHLFPLFFLSIALYFSHIFVFLSFALIVTIHICYQFIYTIFNEPIKKKLYYKKYFVVCIQFIGCILPGILLSAIFIFSKRNEVYVYISKWDLLLQLRSISPLITFNYIDVADYTKAIFYTLLVLSVFIFIARAYSMRNKNLILFVKDLFKTKDIWLFIALVFLMLYFVLPDSNGYSSFISIRISLLFFLFMLVWLVLQKITLWISIPASIFILSLQGMLLSYYSTQLKPYNSLVLEMEKLEPFIQTNGILLPINNSGDWYLGHVSNYLGNQKPMVILENYECGTGYFPLLWNKVQIPNLLLGELSNYSTSVHWISNKNNSTRYIDQVLIIGNENMLEENTQPEINRSLQLYYVQVYTSPHFQLFNLKQ